jgi:large subunit ribosomal protein L15
MNLSNLKPAIGSVKNKKRIARGQGSGRGGTATRGHNGQKSRSGFEGGQMPLQRRVPKFGFKNINRVEHKGINLDTIQALVDAKKIKDEVNLDVLMSNGLVRKNILVKIMGRGALTAKLNFTAHKFTATALAAIEAAGGTATTL